MKKTVLVFILLTLNLLTACTTPVSREQFTRDLTQVVNDKSQLSKYFRRPAFYSESEYEALLKDVLSDKDIVDAVYDDAVSNKRAYSVESILSTGWMRTFERKGMLLLSDQDKAIFVEKAAILLANLPSEKCGSVVRGELMDFKFSKADGVWVKTFSRNLLKKGAVAHDKIFKAPDKAKVGVALVALVSKAKEKMTDDEIETIVRMSIDRDISKHKDICSVLSKVFLLANDLEPKYRNILFDQLTFQKRGSI